MKEEFALETAQSRLLLLAEGILRVVADAGKPWELYSLARDYAIAEHELFEVRGARLSEGEIRAVLCPDVSYTMEGKEMVVRGALRMAASHLTGNNTHAAHGEHLMMDGIMEVERQRAENRNRVLAGRTRTNRG